MKEYKYTFELTEEEVLEYYRYIVQKIPKNKRIRLWIKLSIPILAGFTLFFFNLWPNIFFDAVAATIIFIWITIGSEWVWRQHIILRMDKKFLASLNIVEFKKVTLTFKDKIIVNNKSLRYQEIKYILPLKSSLVFFCGEQDSFILPLRVIGEEQQIKELYRDILLRQEKD